MSDSAGVPHCEQDSTNGLHPPDVPDIAPRYSGRRFDPRCPLTPYERTLHAGTARVCTLLCASREGPGTSGKNNRYFHTLGYEMGNFQKLVFFSYPKGTFSYPRKLFHTLKKMKTFFIPLYKSFIPCQNIFHTLKNQFHTLTFKFLFSYLKNFFHTPIQKFHTL